MANELRISDITGLTYTCEVRQLDDTLIDTVSLTEVGPTRYRGNFPAGSATADTYYDLIYIESGIARAAQTKYWNGTKLLDAADFVTATGFATSTNVSDAQAAIQSDIGDLETHGDAEWSTAIGFSTLTTGDIDTRLAAYGLPTLAQITAAFTEIKGSGWTTTDTLEEIRNNLGGGGSSVEEIVEGILAQVATINLISPLANDAGHISIPIGTTVEFTLTQAFSASWEYIEFVIKDRIDIDVSDDDAILKAIVYEDGSDGGLIVLNGSPVAAGNTSVVITADQPNNLTTFKITDTITAQIAKSSKLYVAFRWVDSGSDSIAATATCNAGHIAAKGGDA